MAWGSASAACFPGPGVDCGWLTSVTHVFSSQEPQPRRSSSCPLLSALCRTQGSGGNRGLLAHLVPRAGALSQSHLGSANALPGCAALGRCTPSLRPVSRPHRAHRLTWWFREPRHWTFLNQFDTEKREHLLKTTTVRPKNGQLFRCPYDTQGREAGVLVTLRGRNRDPHPSTSHLDGREGLSSAPLPSAGQ